MDILHQADIVEMINFIAQAMKNNRSYLIELDSAIGDGDLGITMDKGFAAAALCAESNKSLEISTILMKAGMEIVKVAPSTMGTLMGTGFMRGGKSLAGKDSLAASDLITFFESFLQGIVERGKAKLGDKTIIDVLVPAISAMKTHGGNDIRNLLESAVIGAKEGINAQRGMMSQHGKAAVFREKTRDLVDPGSEAMVILFQACRDSVSLTEKGGII